MKKEYKISNLELVDVKLITGVDDLKESIDLFETLHGHTSTCKVVNFHNVNHDPFLCVFIIKPTNELLNPLQAIKDFADRMVKLDTDNGVLLAQEIETYLKNKSEGN